MKEKIFHEGNAFDFIKMHCVAFLGGTPAEKMIKELKEYWKRNQNLKRTKSKTGIAVYLENVLENLVKGKGS